MSKVKVSYIVVGVEVEAMREHIEDTLRATHINIIEYATEELLNTYWKDKEKGIVLTHEEKIKTLEDMQANHREELESLEVTVYDPCEQCGYELQPHNRQYGMCPRCRANTKPKRE